MAISSGAHIIFDRAFPSEYVYGRAFEREFSHEQVSWMDAAAGSIDAIGIMLLPPGDGGGLDGFFEERCAEDFPFDTWLKVVQGYKDYLGWTCMVWDVIDANMTTEMQVMQSVYAIRKARPTKDETYMSMAHLVSQRSTCLSARVGAVLLSPEGHVIATGYNGTPVGLQHPIVCDRLCGRYRSGENMDACDDVHAEENCIVQAAKNGSNPTGGTIYTTRSPCHRCMRMLVNAGVVEIIYGRKYTDQRAFDMAAEAHIDLRHWRSDADVRIG
jgi:dCMP deaminase